MTARRRIEVKSYGFDEYKQLVGTDPTGGSAWLGLRVPTLPTASLIKPGQPQASSRYLFLGCAFSVAEGSVARLVGYRQMMEIGFVIPGSEPSPPAMHAPILKAAPAPIVQPRPVIFPVTTPGWTFPDATTTWHIRRVGGPNFQGQPSGRPSNATDKRNLRKGTGALTPALLYESITLPAGDPYYTDLTAYVPPNAGRPPGTPLADDPMLGTIYGLQTDWKTPEALGSLDVEVRGQDTIAAYISVGQTDPTKRGNLPLPPVVPANTPYVLGLCPEDEFLLAAKVYGQEARVWRVGVSLIFEVDSVVSEVRDAIGGERRRNG